MTPLVSICCMAYQQESTLRQTLEGFLCQKTSFPIEILVHDDASKDRTADIMREFASRYPEIVKPLYETENQYSKGLPMNETFNFPRTKGKYIALCEGDDYWTDEYKLQKQVGYLESHPECTFCFTNAIITDVSGREQDRAFIPFLPSDAALASDTDRDYDVGELAQLSFIPTASFVFPRENLSRVPKELLAKECYQGDMRMKLLFTALGYARYIADKTCVYRANFPGSAMSRWGSEDGRRTAARCCQIVEMLRDVDEMSQKEYTVPLARVMDEYRVHILRADPTVQRLRESDMRRVFRAMPFSTRCKVLCKAALPRRVKRALGR